MDIVFRGVDAAVFVVDRSMSSVWAVFFTNTIYAIFFYIFHFDSIMCTVWFGLICCYGIPSLAGFHISNYKYPCLIKADGAHFVLCSGIESLFPVG